LNFIKAKIKNDITLEKLGQHFKSADTMLVVWPPRLVSRSTIRPFSKPRWRG
jgi:hypothetical protein